MNKFIIAIISIALVSAMTSCSILRSKMDTVKAEKLTEEKTKREKPAIKKPVTGDTVVARWGPGLWAEGRVDGFNATNSEAKIAWADGSSPSNVDVGDLFPMPKSDDELTVQPGDYTLVKSATDGWWAGAEIRDVGPSVIKAKIVNGGEIVNLSREKVLTVTDTVAADIKDAADKQDFLDRAHEHTPARPEGYMPKVGDHILGAWTTNAWYGGKVKAINGNKAMIVWENGMSPDEAFLERIAPFPTASQPGPLPAVGDFVLVKPTNGNPKAAWLYAQVTAVNGSGIEAKDIDETRDYKAGDYIRLEE